jgi:hypothetical protein
MRTRARLAAPTRVAAVALTAVTLLGGAVACSGEAPGEDNVDENQPANSEDDEEGEGGSD